MDDKEFIKYKKRFTEREWLNLPEKTKKRLRFDSAYAILTADRNPFESFLKRKEDKFFKRNKKYEYVGWGCSRNVILCKELNVVYKFPNNLEGVIGNYLEAGLGSEGYEHISPCSIFLFDGVPVLKMDRVYDRSLDYYELFERGNSDDIIDDDIPEWLYDQDGYQVGDHDLNGLVYFDLGYSLSLANDYDLIPSIKEGVDKFVPLVFPEQTFEKLYKDGDDWDEHNFPVKLLKMAKRCKKKA